MKRAAILRHAKSSWDDPGIDDFDRSLSERGRSAARLVGRELKRRDLRFDFVLASSAARVRQTIDGVLEQYDLEVPIRFDDDLYLASAATLLTLLRALPRDVSAPLLVGHNPGLERLLGELTHDDRGGLRQRISGKYPTGALALVEFPVDRWEDVQPGSGEIVGLILPRELD